MELSASALSELILLISSGLAGAVLNPPPGAPARV